MGLQLNHAEVVVDFEGEAIQHNAGTDDAPKLRSLTFRDLVQLALNNTLPGEHLGAEAKARCYAISQKFYQGKTARLSVDEAAFIKERAGVILNQMTYGRLCDWVEGRPQFVATDEEGEDPEEDS